MHRTRPAFKPAARRADGQLVGSTLIFLALSLAWGPVLVLLHELGHAFAALALTDGEVSIGLDNGRGPC